MDDSVYFLGRCLRKIVIMSVEIFLQQQCPRTLYCEWPGHIPVLKPTIQSKHGGTLPLLWKCIWHLAKRKMERNFSMNAHKFHKHVKLIFRLLLYTLSYRILFYIAALRFPQILVLDIIYTSTFCGIVRFFVTGICFYLELPFYLAVCLFSNLCYRSIGTSSNVSISSRTTHLFRVSKNLIPWHWMVPTFKRNLFN